VNSRLADFLLSKELGTEVARGEINRIARLTLPMSLLRRKAANTLVPDLIWAGTAPCGHAPVDERLVGLEASPSRNQQAGLLADGHRSVDQVAADVLGMA